MCDPVLIGGLALSAAGQYFSNRSAEKTADKRNSILLQGMQQQGQHQRKINDLVNQAITPYETANMIGAEDDKKQALTSGASEHLAAATATRPDSDVRGKVSDNYVRQMAESEANRALEAEKMVKWYADTASPNYVQDDFLRTLRRNAEMMTGQNIKAVGDANLNYTLANSVTEKPNIGAALLKGAGGYFTGQGLGDLFGAAAATPWAGRTISKATLDSWRP